MRRAIVRAGCVLALAFGGTATVLASGPYADKARKDPKYKDHVNELIGPHLEEAFSSFNDACGLAAYLKPGTSPIPAPLQRQKPAGVALPWTPAVHLGFFNTLTIFQRWFAANATRQTVLADLRSAAGLKTPDPTLVRGLQIEQHPEVYAGGSTWKYSADCAFAVNAAVSAGVATPALSATVQAQVGSSLEANMFLLLGKFTSPLGALQARADTDPQKRVLMFNLWDIYSGQQSPAKALKYVDELTGVYAVSGSGAKLNALFKTAVQTDYSAIVFSASASANMQINSDSAFVGSESGTYVMGEYAFASGKEYFRPYMELKSFYDAKQVLAVLTSSVNGPKLLTTKNPTVAVYDTLSESLELAGIPEASCKATWKAVTITKSDLPIKSEFIAKDGVCRLTVDISGHEIGKSAQNLKSQKKGGIGKTCDTLEYTLVYPKKVDNDALELTVPGHTVCVDSTFTLQTVDAIWPASTSNDGGATWTVTMTFETGKQAVADVDDTGKFIVACDEPPLSLPVTAKTTLKSPGSVELILTMAKTDYDAAKGATGCLLNGGGFSATAAAAKQAVTLTSPVPRIRLALTK